LNAQALLGRAVQEDAAQDSELTPRTAGAFAEEIRRADAQVLVVCSPCARVVCEGCCVVRGAR